MLNDSTITVKGIWSFILAEERNNIGFGWNACLRRFSQEPLVLSSVPPGKV